MGFFLPKRLKQCDNWILHKDKVPIDPRTRKKANPTKKGCSYDKALAFLEYEIIPCSGLGFTFTKDINMTFIDIDHCIDENGDYTELAKEMTELFSDCYQEISLSEKGIHIVCIGNVPSAVKNTKEGIEIYSRDRYMAFTGNAINAVEPQEAQNRLDNIFHRFSLNKAEHQPNIATQKKNSKSFDANEEELIQIIKNSKQGGKWEKLHNGDIKKYESMSEAAMAYIAILSYFARYDIEIISNIMHQSSFSNTKHCKPAYIERAIAKSKATAIGSKTKTKRKRVNTREIDEYKKPTRKRVRI